MEETTNIRPFKQERLNEQDAVEFLPALVELRGMHETLARLQGELNQHNTNTVKQQGVFEYLFKRIQIKYGLVEGDDITADGIIVRKG